MAIAKICLSFSAASKPAAGLCEDLMMRMAGVIVAPVSSMTHVCGISQ
jgi:hypothetical protein